MYYFFLTSFFSKVHSNLLTSFGLSHRATKRSTARRRAEKELPQLPLTRKTTRAVTRRQMVRRSGVVGGRTERAVVVGEATIPGRTLRTLRRRNTGRINALRTTTRRCTWRRMMYFALTRTTMLMSLPARRLTLMRRRWWCDGRGR